jgi:hypothetical protein
MPGFGSSWRRRRLRRLVALVLLPLLLLAGSLLGPLWARAVAGSPSGLSSDLQPGLPPLLRQVPGPSPRQTIENFLPPRIKPIN